MKRRVHYKLKKYERIILELEWVRTLLRGTRRQQAFTSLATSVSPESVKTRRTASGVLMDLSLSHLCSPSTAFLAFAQRNWFARSSASSRMASSRLMGNCRRRNLFSLTECDLRIEQLDYRCVLQEHCVNQLGHVCEGEAELHILRSTWQASQ